MGEVRLLEGQITSASAPGAAGLGEVLRAAGLADALAAVGPLEGLRAEALAGRVLERGLLEEAALEALLLQQVQGAVAELLGWAQGMFAFEPAPVVTLPEELRRAPRLAVDQILLEVMRALDESAR